MSQTLPLAMSNSEALLSAKVDFVGGAKSLGATRADRVGAGFFETVGIPLLRGRTFDARDESDDARVLIVNETMARQVWPGDEPVGKTVDFDGARWQVIGVVGDIRIGIRMALGARRADVLWLVLRESSAIVVAGTIVGLAAALGVTWALGSFRRSAGGDDAHQHAGSPLARRRPCATGGACVARVLSARASFDTHQSGHGASDCE